MIACKRFLQVSYPHKQVKSLRLFELHTLDRYIKERNLFLLLNKELQLEVIAPGKAQGVDKTDLSENSLESLDVKGELFVDGGLNLALSQDYCPELCLNEKGKKKVRWDEQNIYKNRHV